MLHYIPASTVRPCRFGTESTGKDQTISYVYSKSFIFQPTKVMKKGLELIILIITTCRKRAGICPCHSHCWHPWKLWLVQTSHPTSHTAPWRICSWFPGATCKNACWFGSSAWQLWPDAAARHRWGAHLQGFCTHISFVLLCRKHCPQWSSRVTYPWASSIYSQGEASPCTSINRVCYIPISNTMYGVVRRSVWRKYAYKQEQVEGRLFGKGIVMPPREGLGDGPFLGQNPIGFEGL